MSAQLGDSFANTVALGMHHAASLANSFSNGFNNARKSNSELNLEKLTSLGIGLAVFFGVIAILFFIGEKSGIRVQRWFKYFVFLAPALILLIVGLVYPSIRTFYLSFYNANGSQFVGLENYKWAVTQPDALLALKNTLIWTIVVPIGSVGFGLAIAVLTDRMRRASIPKSLIFMPMAISFVGASIIWKFVYEFRTPNKPQIGLLSQLTKMLGFEPTNWLLTFPLNTFLLIVIMIWIQTGFAMVILSGAIKGIPDDIIEAAMLDGASGWRRFRNITIPMIRGTLIVVLSTITVATLKVFDIVRTMTGGNFKTSVIANEMYQQTFRALNYGTGAALAVILFVGVSPLVIYNVIQLKREREVR